MVKSTPKYGTYVSKLMGMRMSVYVFASKYYSPSTFDPPNGDCVLVSLLDYDFITG